MQNSENYRSIFHCKKREKRYRKSRGKDFYTSFQVVCAEHTGDSAHQHKGCGKQGTDVAENIKESSGKIVVKHISQSKQCMVKHHAEYTETAYFIKKVDSFFCGQVITLFKLNVERRKKIY